MRPSQSWAESVPPGWNRVKLSENLGATAVAPVAPVNTSLQLDNVFRPNVQTIEKKSWVKSAILIDSEPAVITPLVEDFLLKHSLHCFINPCF